MMSKFYCTSNLDMDPSFSVIDDYDITCAELVLWHKAVTDSKEKLCAIVDAEGSLVAYAPKEIAEIITSALNRHYDDERNDERNLE